MVVTALVDDGQKIVTVSFLSLLWVTFLAA
jgi:hypothetical protein